MNWVDMCIFAILAVNSLIGFNQGFIVSIFSLAGLLISYFAARLYYPIIAQFILNNQGIYDKMRGFVDKRLYSMFEGKPDIFGSASLLEGLNLPKPLVDIISKSPRVGSYTSEVSKYALDIMSEALTRIFIDVISLIIAFILARIILIFVVRILSAFSDIPILKQFNKILGLAFGLIKGILIILIILAILTPLVSVSPNGALAEGVFSSTVGYYLYDNNILLKYLKDLVL
ncbi:CvpA family protein [Proteiniborus sp. MB09-C3]|uniref:CvpA family protein n=1 Tax=Proteiniborus sp. MB09-C3 TaxID=3050072 RepID=UPI002552D3D6|nr:CvpA family protein [Proteiniborus sp. MB09-C3]WIV12537.1 CvpA family protein [Proteiniborus sp. MB09-C3]